MDDSKPLIHHFHLYDFLSGRSAAELEQCINQVFGQDTVSSVNCRRCSRSFAKATTHAKINHGLANHWLRTKMSYVVTSSRIPE